MYVHESLGALVKPTPPSAVKRVPIRAGNSRYEALVGPGLLERIGEMVTPLVRGPRCAVIADENTARLFAEPLLRSLCTSRFQPTLITVAAGEASKSLEQLGAACNEMAAAGLDRTSFVVALGGGVLGDLAGFAAAIYFRGIPYVQVPTTLLAQVDSSIGGKTAVNLSAGKNLLGAVHQPVLVVADIETLQTLAPRELRQGFAEIIKHAIIADASMFEALVEVVQLFKLQGGPAAGSKLAPLISLNIEIKARIVAQDEQDLSGQRAVLNFGHTVGHAIESAAGYGSLLHGEALSLGIVAACEVSARKAGLSEAERGRIISTLQAFQLPTRLPANFPRAQILPALQADKKFERGEVRFVVTPALGSARLTNDVSLAEIGAAIELL